MEPSLLHQYRRDRRKLLEYLISSSSSSSPAGLAASSLSDVDLDTISADYVLSRLQSGGVFDIAEATEQYHRESAYPISMHLQLKNSFFLITDPDLSGSPPRRVPPRPDVMRSTNPASTSLPNSEGRDNDGFTYQEASFTPLKLADGKVPSLGLPCLISEAMDLYIKRRLTQFAESRNGRIDVPQISLGLLHDIHESDFSNEKYCVQWKSRQLSMLEEIINSCADLTENERQECSSTMSLSERAEVLSAVWQVITKLSSLPGKFGFESETYYWTAVYHLNIRLYEKLLLGVFDILDEGHLIEEADEILELVRITWSTLGITEKLHEVLYIWLCFQQFLATQEPSLLEYVIFKLERVLSDEGGDQNEDPYETSNFRRVMTLVSITGVPVMDDYVGIKLIKLNTSDKSATRKLKSYVESSIEAEYCRVASAVDLESKMEKMHPLALLANELHSVAKREFSIFYPELRSWCPEAGIISARKLNKFYGERLGPYLEKLSCVSEDVRSVLSAANMFDHGLTCLYMSACEEDRMLIQELDHYKIEELAGPIILDWVIAQHTRILQWIERASDIEEWEPLSSQQKQAASAVEVFRIIEETVDQFFGWNLRMNMTHLQALLSVIFHSLDAYLLKVSEQLVDKKHLLPSAPPLTRYTEMNIPIIRRKVIEFTLNDNTVNGKLAASTISKLCIRLNTLQYIKKQIGILEGGLRKSWAELRSIENHKLGKEEPPESSEEDFLTYDETVDELFVSTFTCIKDSSTDAIGKICDLIGSRMVFWDLRDTFLLWLYRDTVEDARLDRFLPQFDTVLDHICGVLDDSLRDLVVLSICRASLEGYVWVLLDGGSSRAFSDSDVLLMEDDLNTLKEFFIAEGEGLPRSIVDQESKVAEHILHLYSFQTDVLIQMLLNASEHISSGLDSQKRGNVPEDAQILIRILCHKKDREASKFLKRQYQLPMASDSPSGELFACKKRFGTHCRPNVLLSLAIVMILWLQVEASLKTSTSQLENDHLTLFFFLCPEYDDTPSKDSTGSTAISEIFKQSASVDWKAKGQKSLYSFKKKIQEATSEIRQAAW
ncbi:hypothetical protein CDL15_Pgr006185 [Punica granatum]|uniref:Protein unc-13 homolog n=1 Tax=Punica granatum TaxID=22663 RepID=A0A218VUK8_PUNGR|nr:hypothetical protein CDL15_Pgr006185 [Punica granatum]